MTEPKTKKLKRWTKEEIDFLKENFATMTHKELGEVLGRPEQGVRYKCFELNLYKKEYPWADKELNYLKDNYNNMTYRQIGHELGRTLDAVRSKAATLGLIKDSYYCDVNYFEKINTEEKAYWLGFIFADGWTYLSKSTEAGCLGIELQKNDIGHLRKFNKSINGNYKVSTRERTSKDTWGRWYEKINEKYNLQEVYPTCLIRIFSRPFTDHLINHGAVPNKSLIKQFPTTVPQHLIRHFIRGYFDGNGYVSGKTSLKFGISSESKNFLESIKEILSANEIYTGNICITKHNDFIDKDTCFALPVYSNYENSLRFYNYIYKGAAIYLDRKYFKATSLKKSVQRKIS